MSAQIISDFSIVTKFGVNCVPFFQILIAFSQSNVAHDTTAVSSWHVQNCRILIVLNGITVNISFHFLLHNKTQKVSVSIFMSYASTTENHQIFLPITLSFQINGDSKSLDLNNDWYQLYAWGPMSVGKYTLQKAIINILKYHSRFC